MTAPSKRHLKFGFFSLYFCFVVPKEFLRNGIEVLVGDAEEHNTLVKDISKDTFITTHGYRVWECMVNH